ncbi:hypothetical protein NADFUDRAFT_42424 [Nadsonia fulvescens var. elongata DSM 6958]|uniref:Uncharacterized protein n=1 Tax=Nadsonia fulvescens var. elongata DSM 6958 TaxID=857566 RepID=A0A1E3PJM2_9ASCO|nr:hypothetical protein NADFUDRAFT_42424 [Nadsonia fulvescens var. elongata DSM 6958]
MKHQPRRKVDFPKSTNHSNFNRTETLTPKSNKLIKLLSTILPCSSRVKKYEDFHTRVPDFGSGSNTLHYQLVSHLYSPPFTSVANNEDYLGSLKYNLSGCSELNVPRNLTVRFHPSNKHPMELDSAVGSDNSDKLSLAFFDSNKTCHASLATLQVPSNRFDTTNSVKLKKPYSIQRSSDKINKVDEGLSTKSLRKIKVRTTPLKVSEPQIITASFQSATDNSFKTDYPIIYKTKKWLIKKMKRTKKKKTTQVAEKRISSPYITHNNKFIEYCLKVIWYPFAKNYRSHQAEKKIHLNKISPLAHVKIVKKSSNAAIEANKSRNEKDTSCRHAYEGAMFLKYKKAQIKAKIDHEWGILKEKDQGFRYSPNFGLFAKLSFRYFFFGDSLKFFI